MAKHQELQPKVIWEYGEVLIIYYYADSVTWEEITALVLFLRIMQI